MLMQVMILYSSLSLIADTSSDQFVMDINLMGAFADFVKAWQEKNHAGDHSQGDVEASTIYLARPQVTVLLLKTKSLPRAHPQIVHTRLKTT